MFKVHCVCDVLCVFSVCLWIGLELQMDRLKHTRRSRHEETYCTVESTLSFFGWCAQTRKRRNRCIRQDHVRMGKASIWGRAACACMLYVCFMYEMMTTTTNRRTNTTQKEIKGKKRETKEKFNFLFTIPRRVYLEGVCICILFLCLTVDLIASWRNLWTLVQARQLEYVCVRSIISLYCVDGASQ